MDLELKKVDDIHDEMREIIDCKSETEDETFLRMKERKSFVSSASRRCTTVDE